MMKTVLNDLCIQVRADGDHLHLAQLSTEALGNAFGKIEWEKLKKPPAAAV